MILIQSTGIIELNMEEFTFSKMHKQVYMGFKLSLIPHSMVELYMLRTLPI
jgi:hypothetical protein